MTHQKQWLMKIVILWLAAIGLSLPILMTNAKAQSMRIQLEVNGETLHATLDDTPISRDFMTLLPMSLTLSDYNATEKISDLPRKLDMTNAPSGYEPKKGDLSFYAPWGNLAIFYRDFRMSNGLIRIGRIEGDMSALIQSSPYEIKFSAEEPPENLR